MPALLASRMFDAWLAATESREGRVIAKSTRVDNALSKVTEAFWDVCCPCVTTRTLGGPITPDPLMDIWWAAVMTSAVNTVGATRISLACGTRSNRP